MEGGRPRKLHVSNVPRLETGYSYCVQADLCASGDVQCASRVVIMNLCLRLLLACLLWSILLSFFFSLKILCGEGRARGACYFNDTDRPLLPRWKTSTFPYVFHFCRCTIYSYVYIFRDIAYISQGNNITKNSQGRR